MNGTRSMAGGDDVFVGRHDVLAVIAEELSSAMSGPRLVWVEGEPGIGKTSVLRTALSERNDRWTVWAAGVEDERELPFSVIDQLGRGLVARVDADPLAVGADLLVAVGDSRDPVVLVIDDLQWVDDESSRALLFALRRLRSEPVLVIVTSQPHALAGMPAWARLLGDASQCRKVEVSGLKTAELIDLARVIGGALDVDTAERLQQHTAGHPLHARALLAEFGVRRLADAPGVLPAPRDFALLIVARLGALPREARDLVEAAAVLGRSSRLPDVAAIAELDDPLPAADAAISAGLLEWSPSHEVQFLHPLVRAAVYNDMSLIRRRALHLSAAAASTGDGAIEHRVAAAYEYDANLADELELVAAKDAAEGRSLLSVRRLRQAASVSAASPDRDRRVLMAAEALIGAGMMAAARTVAIDVTACAESPYRSFVLGCIAFAEGRVADGEALVATAAAASPDGPGDLAARAAAGAGIARMLMGRWDEAITACHAAIAGDADWASGLARYALAVCYVRLGRFDALDELRTRVEAEMAASQLPRLEALGVLGVIKLFSDDLTGAAEDLAEVAERARAGERTRLLVAALAAHAEVSFRLGHWEDAIVASELGASLAQDTEQIVGLQQAHAAAAVVHARRGRFDLSQAHVDTLGTIESLLPWWGGSALVGTSRAVLAEARGDHDAMYQAMASLVDHPTDEPGERLGQWPWLVVGVDALIGVGRLDVARALLDALAALVAQRNLLTPAVEVARLRGRLAEAADDLAQAELQYRTGAEASGAMPYARGRVLLAHGRLLRRMGKRRDAVAQLQRARAELAALAAAPDVRACDDELAACGEAILTRIDEHASLTPAELSVAHLVAQGLSNREVAARLYVSPKTVEYHLGHIFAKLHITSRRQLAGAFPGTQGHD